jgi:PAS domain S-box-containing protein
MDTRAGELFHNTFVRYLFAILLVAITFALRLWLSPLTGIGAPFVLFFAAVLVISAAAGIGPGICAIVLSAPLDAYMFAARAGYPPFQAAGQGLLFAVDGSIAIYLTFLMKKKRQAAQDANQQLRVANEQIARSMKQTRDVIELSPDAFFQADLDYRLTDVNQAACRLLAYERDELLGKTIFEIIPVEQGSRVRAARTELLVPGQIHRAEWIQKRKDGTFVPVEVSANILPDGRWQAFARDISERKRIERALQESEERFRLTVDEAPIGMALVGLDGHYVRVNRALCEIVGYSSTELTELTSDAITHPDDVDMDVAARGQLARGEIPRYEREKRYVRKDGTTVDVLLNVSTLRSRDGTPRYFIAQIEDITERKRAEEAARAVSAELRQTLQTAGTGLTHCSRDLRYVSANAAYAQFIGVPLDQIVGRPIVEVMGEAAFEIIRPRVEKVLSGERVEYEDELPIAGEVKSVQAIYTPDRDASGKVVGWVGSIMDISQRRRIEQELKAANAFLDAVIENIPLILFMKESESLRVVRLNRTAEEFLGWPKQTLIGKSDYDLWPKELADFFVQKDRETLKSGRIVDIPEEQIQTHHQGVRILHTKKVPILDAAGHPAFLLGIAEDITEQKRIEKEQRFLSEVSVTLSASLEYEQTLANLTRLAVQNVADWAAVDVTNEQGRLSRLKVACADPRQTALCAFLEEMPFDRDLPHLMRSVVESKKPILVKHVTPEYIESLAQGPGHLQALLATGITSFVAVPILMRTQPLGALMLGASTLSRVYGQHDLRLAEALADRAAMAIENARLYRASVHATHLRDQVLSVVAHDLRNPLSAILLQVETLIRRSADPEQRSEKVYETIHRAATRMNRLIQDLLDVALMEAGQLTIEPSRVSASDLIAGAVEMLRPLAASSALDLRGNLGRDVPEIWGDRDRLLQVFENLIGNAIKFTKPGGRITVSAASKAHEVIFRVTDTGSGIAPEKLPRVFDRFWQATRANRQGAGLGLPITKGIVEAHGGRIWVESTPNRGTTFSFTIPQATSERGRPSGPSGSSHLEGYRAA